jgi:hypothetical protein
MATIDPGAHCGGTGAHDPNPLLLHMRVRRVSTAAAEAAGPPGWSIHFTALPRACLPCLPAVSSELRRRVASGRGIAPRVVAAR